MIHISRRAAVLMHMTWCGDVLSWRYMAEDPADVADGVAVDLPTCAKCIQIATGCSIAEAQAQAVVNALTNPHANT